LIEPRGSGSVREIGLLRCSGTVQKLVVPRGGGTVVEVGFAEVQWDCDGNWW